MKTIKNLSFLAAFAVLLIVASCGSDDSGSSESSATVTIDGTVYKKPSDNEIAYLESPFTDEPSYSIGGDVANGNDTVNFSINVPSLEVATYTKSANGDDVWISMDSDSFDMNTFSPLNSEIEDFTDYSIEITNVTENTISGTFSATIQSSSSEDTKEVSGEFVAIDFASLFGDLFN